MKAEPMRYHGPGWNVETSHRLYQLWAPGKIIHQNFPEYDTGKTRDFWQAAWQDDDDERAFGFYKGQNKESALAIFPPNVRKAFIEATKDLK